MGASEGEPLTLQEIATRESLPGHFLSKIFQKLLRHGLIESHRGLQRGYTLARPASEVTLRQVLEAIEGPDLFDRCMFTRRQCGGEGYCPLHAYWGRARVEMGTLFAGITLDAVAAPSVGGPEAGGAPGPVPQDEPAWISEKARALYS